MVLKYVQREINKREYLFVVSIALFFNIIGIIFFLPPDYKVIVGSVGISIIVFLFVILFLFLYTALLLIIRRKLHALLGSAFGICLLVFIMHRLTHPFYFILLTGLFVIIEMLIYSMKRKKE